MCSTSRRWTSPSLSIMSVHENVEVIEVLYRATKHPNNKCDASFVCSHLLRHYRGNNMLKYDCPLPAARRGSQPGPLTSSHLPTPFALAAATCFVTASMKRTPELSSGA
jgi:hypothetical protein